MPTWMQPRETRTDASGAFTIEVDDDPEDPAPTKRVHVWATFDDFVTPKFDWRLQPEPRRLEPLRLGPALRPRVLVVDPHGAPVEGAKVDLTFCVPDQEDARALVYILMNRTASDGEAALTPVPDRDDWSVSLRVEAPNRPPYRVFEVELDTLRAGRLDVRFSAGCTVRGTALLPSGSPARGAAITVLNDEGAWPNLEHQTTAGERRNVRARGCPHDQCTCSDH